MDPQEDRTMTTQTKTRDVNVTVLYVADPTAAAPFS